MNIQPHAKNEQHTLNNCSDIKKKIVKKCLKNPATSLGESIFAENSRATQDQNHMTN